MSAKNKALFVLVLCEVLAMSLWFSASAVLPELKAQFQLTPFHASLFTSMVSFGFVCGTLISTWFGLADRLSPHRFFMLSALLGAAVNAGLLWITPDRPEALLLRFITGVIMAGVYPVGMKMAASWAQKDMGLLIGLLVGALTLGSALPHLFNGFGGLDWRLTIMAASFAAILAAFAVQIVELGPNYTTSPRFRPGYILEALKSKALRHANYGYFGHMWELYAMWGWIGVFMYASFDATGLNDPKTSANFATFAIVGTGAIGSLLGGWLADRIGRTALTMAAMAISGLCALLIGLTFGANPWIVLCVAIIWGISIIADSAQFSSCVMELADKHMIGTMVTFQTCIGFILSLITIHAVPYWVDWLGWTYAFAPLAIGPFLGVLAMARLRSLPEAIKIAHGRR